jgi:hypothetical protein
MEQEKSEATQAPAPRWMAWAGRVLTALPVLLLASSGVMKILAQPQLVKNLTEHLGYPAGAVLPIGITELLCAVLYAIPQTAGLGAVLVTGFFGGAVATHVRAGDPLGQAMVPLLGGILAWGGLFFRDPRVRALLPLRK